MRKKKINMLPHLTLAKRQCLTQKTRTYFTSKNEPGMYSDLENKTKNFVNSEILGIQIWPKKCVNYDKFTILTKQSKSSI